MNLRTLVPLAWTLLGITVVGLLYAMYRAATDSAPTPEASRGLGVIVAGILFGVVAILGVLLYVAVRKQSMAGGIAYARPSRPGEALRRDSRVDALGTAHPRPERNSHLPHTLRHIPEVPNDELWTDRSPRSKARPPS